MTQPIPSQGLRTHKLIQSLREQALVLSVSAAVLVAYYIVFRKYFPNSYGLFGHDYMQQMPNLLTGYYWFRNNGLFSIPWFNPAQCGGVPFYPDPGHGLYSLPQLLVLAFNPVLAIKITFLVFALLGYVGFYLLLRRKFQTNQPYAVLGATLFLFNGFYAHRMIIGHPFHAFMLVPWLAISLLPGRTEPRCIGVPLRKHVYRAAIAGAIIAYMFHSAMMHVIPPVILAIVVILLIHSFLYGGQKHTWFRLGAAIVLALGLSSSKLVASLSFLKHFPRDAYTMPGFPSLFEVLNIAMQSLFTRPPIEQAFLHFKNTQWALEQHEVEFGVTPLPLIIILATVILYLFTKKPEEMAPSKRALAYAGAIAGLLFIPLAVNFYQPDWNAFLESIPIIKSSSMLLRWFAMYIPVSILGSMLLANSSAIAKRYALWIALASIIFVIGYQATENRAYYDIQTYDGAQIARAYERSKSSGTVVPIREIAKLGGDDRTLMQNNLMAAGLSQLTCYNAIFGYRLEWFPVGDLHVGPALDVRGDHLNVKNPACYVFPDENNCSPGDQFKIEQRAEAEKFLSYNPYAFRKSSVQKVADLCNLVFVVLFCSALIHAVVMAAIGKQTSRSSETSSVMKKKTDTRGAQIGKAKRD